MSGVSVYPIEGVNLKQLRGISKETGLIIKEGVSDDLTYILIKDGSMEDVVRLAIDIPTGVKIIDERRLHILLLRNGLRRCYVPELSTCEYNTYIFPIASQSVRGLIEDIDRGIFYAYTYSVKVKEESVTLIEAIKIAIDSVFRSPTREELNVSISDFFNRSRSESK